MLGEKIKTLRVSNSLTQKDLADQLYVTAQAVSRWEKNEVEPSITTLNAIAKIFKVSVSDLLEEDGQRKDEQPTLEKEEIAVAQPAASKVVLAVCESCNKPIYNGSDIVRKTEYFGRSAVNKVICVACDRKQREEKLRRDVAYGTGQRRKSFVWGGVFSALITLIATIAGIVATQSLAVGIVCAIGGLLFFPFISCLYLKNNFIEDVVLDVSSWSVRFPGLIFSLDLDGILWFISVKILFGIISFFISIICVMFAIVLGWALSLFVYPFALTKNIRHPELTER